MLIKYKNKEEVKMSYNELSYEEQNIDVVRGVQFSVISPNEMKKISVVEVTKTDTYTGNDCVVGGLFDPRMGVLEHNKICTTCEQKNISCNGHFGHINLARPIHHPMFFDTTKKLLKCICYRCSRLLISHRSTNEDYKNEIKRIKQIKKHQKRWDAITKLCGNNQKLKFCGDDMASGEENNGCRARQPARYIKDSALKIFAEWKDGTEVIDKREMTCEDILRIFQRISIEDMELLGFDPRWNRPDWLIMTTLLVPPPCVRPSIIEENGQRREDDLTHKLSEVVKYNNQLKQRIDSGKGTDDQLKVLTNILQYHVATFMDNQIPGLPVSQQRNGRKLKAVADRLKKKEGRIRGNLNGKRVDQSARSVITPDPYIGLEEIGVPIRVAMNLTFPEYVNEYNIESLRSIIINGPDVYPGAKYVRLATDKITKSLKYADRDKIALELKFGDIVDRHLLDGDYVLFNRQPSLHKMSMMGHKVKVMKHQTFRLNVLDTAPYNADFDGDEMNLFLAQHIQTMSELMDLPAIPFMIITPRDGAPIIEVVQDTMLGSFKLTKDYTRIGDKTMANLQMVNSYFNGKFIEPAHKKTFEYSGKQAYSAILPPGLFVEMKNKGGEKFKIENSKIVSGSIDKSVFHSITKGIIPIINHDYSPFEVQRLLDNTQRLICRWLAINGFSVGISDLVIEKDTEEKLKTTISLYKAKAYNIIENSRQSKLENNSIFGNEEFFEREMLQVLNELTGKMNKIGHERIDETKNRMINMVNSGSKGKPLNITLMVACVGQQNVDGKRVAYGFTDRTLPHFTKYDDGPEARGFVENSFISGLSPQEVFFHAMGGREGLIDTAVKSVTGDTEIIIIENNKSKSVKIGEWIDSYLDDENYKSKVEHSEVANQELLNLDKKVFIPTCNEKGEVTWGEMTAITRHDPGEHVYTIKTLGGRSVTVAESKSLLIWDSELKEFHEIDSRKVKEGMFVPLTEKLPEPPVITTEFDMSEYFPKDKYIHGTEFNKAVSMMKVTMGTTRIQIPRGWWEKHNGISFITPYTKKASLTRVTSGRSNTENIKDGCIYPYHASRDTCRIPDKFELNYDNGRFIGLFLADGHADLSLGQVVITKKDPHVIAFVKSWFDKFAIKSLEKTDKKKLGSTTTVSGYSTLLTIFMTKFVGHGSQNKFVPDVAFTAPIEFVKGIVSGYFSGDGSIDKTGVVVSSVSKNLIDGISFLCSRINIFGKISTTQQKSNNLGTENILPLYTISIRAQWARVFRDNIDLIQEYKNTALKSIDTTNYHRNFQSNNNVVLDQIVEISKITPEKYPKLYDVTVPSTLNFQIKSGIVCRDTSETGYIQRRLIKAMEDAKVYYDQTVRNASGVIQQFLYGEDGMDGTKIENHYINYINYDYPKMDQLYNLRPSDKIDMYLSKNAQEQMQKEPEWIDMCKKHFEEIISDKDFIIEKINNGESNEKIQYPIPFDRIIKGVLERLKSHNLTDIPTDLTPKYILDNIERLKEKLYIIRKGQGIKYLHILLRYHLSPKVIITKHHMSKVLFDWVISEIERYFIESIVHPGEMVGIVAAQSIGEKGTQQTLDSFHSSGTAAAVKATSGVPRLKELLSVSKNIKTPTLKIFLKEDIGTVLNPTKDSEDTITDPRLQEKKELSRKMMQELEVTRMSDILNQTEIYWDPPRSFWITYKYCRG